MNKPSTAMAVTASLLAAGCASSPPGEVKFATRFRDASTRRDAVRDLLNAQLEERGHSVLALSWSVLDGVRDAFSRGGTSRAMAMFWIDEIDRRFEARVGETRAGLAVELGQMTDAEVAAILATAQPQSLRRNSAPPSRAIAYHYSINATAAYRRAKVTAQCESLTSTPSAWAATHPGGPPFDFAAHGIDIRQAAHQCSTHEARQ